MQIVFDECPERPNPDSNKHSTDIQIKQSGNITETDVNTAKNVLADYIFKSSEPSDPPYVRVEFNQDIEPSGEQQNIKFSVKVNVGPVWKYEYNSTNKSVLTIKEQNSNVNPPTFESVRTTGFISLPNVDAILALEFYPTLVQSMSAEKIWYIYFPNVQLQIETASQQS